MCVLGQIAEAKEYGGGKVNGILIANKTDLRREVSEKEASSWARRNGYLYAECSAKTGDGVQEVTIRHATLKYSHVNRLPFVNTKAVMTVVGRVVQQYSK